METKNAENATINHPVVTSEDLVKHWQGHRSLTRRVIEAFPEKELYEFSIGGMRPFAELVMEMITIAHPGIVGVATGKWEQLDHGTAPKTKEGLLELWDKTTEQIDTYWPQISPQRFQETDVAFGQYENQIYASLFYFIDNEIHHRGQGYVYLRALGVTPPPFWER
ncbi:DinB family protein [Sinomicrobium weinanense]|uniref:Damage-inducible protein DinB n=1 Tax=Sinomicrobium weinanense TaxID=2842200 RepID=A0A926JTF4_9FLAO|nr:DinB family protein [Sinomicrobium weinanense]MBC9797044.1 damage-inducible protein DinB [Sinomicrobium weinanense]MBU3122039.1 DinB family protein [Sinomicrobium weinanense]